MQDYSYLSKTGLNAYDQKIKEDINTKVGNVDDKVTTLDEKVNTILESLYWYDGVEETT